MVLISFAARSLAIYEQLNSYLFEDKKLLEQRVAIIDKQIDKAVYKLYDLTEEEVKIVEGEWRCLFNLKIILALDQHLKRVDATSHYCLLSTTKINKIILCFESPTATAPAKIVGVNRNTVNRYFNII